MKRNRRHNPRGRGGRHGGRGGAVWVVAVGASGLLWLSGCGGTVRDDGDRGDDLGGEDGAGGSPDGNEPGDDPVGGGGRGTKPEPPSAGGWPAAGGWPSAGGAVSAGGAPTAYLCGDGFVDDGEECDGENLNGHTCASVTMGALPAGTPSCSFDCRLLLLACEFPGAGGAGGGPSAYTCVPSDADVPTIDPTMFPACGSYLGGPSMGRCVPAGIVTQQLPTPQDVCDGGSLCMAESRVRMMGHGCFVPCSSSLGGEGACVPSYLMEAQMPGVVDLLGQVTCQDGETCTPCVSPLDDLRTGACD